MSKKRKLELTTNQTFVWHYYHQLWLCPLKEVVIENFVLQVNARYTK